MTRQTIRLLDVTIDALTLPQAVDRAKAFIQAGGFHHIVTPGPEFLLEATAHARFRKILNQADLALPDGMGVVIGSRLTGQRLRHRVPGVDFVEALLDQADVHGWSVFLYGGRHPVAEQAAEKIQRRWRHLKIVGLESETRGAWSKIPTSHVVERIHLAKPDILLVALGAPKQELWIDRHRTALHEVKVAIGVGRTFEYLAGTVKRAPAHIRRLGLEWLVTYLTAERYYQPQLRRQRVKNATLHFIWEILQHGRGKQS